MGGKGIHSHRNTAGVEPSINKTKQKNRLPRPDLSDHGKVEMKYLFLRTQKTDHMHRWLNQNINEKHGMKYLPPQVVAPLEHIYKSICSSHF